ncbi:hypothetical protein [Candidatus Mesenet endosymbiont of Agriotes lineatus]
MAYQNIFGPFMELIKPFMKSHGFTTRGNNFYIRHPRTYPSTA